jgi:hypothetical protein
MTDPDCPYCHAPLPEGQRHSCVPLRGRVHPTNAFYFNDNGEPRLVQLHKGATVPKNAPPSSAIDRYPHPWDIFEPLGPICTAMEVAGLPRAFGREAATAALEHDGVGDLMRAWADADNDAERMAIVLDIEKQLGDIRIAHLFEGHPTVPITPRLVERFPKLVGGIDVALNVPLQHDDENKDLSGR